MQRRELIKEAIIKKPKQFMKNQKAAFKQGLEQGDAWGKTEKSVSKDLSTPDKPKNKYSPFKAALGIGGATLAAAGIEAYRKHKNSKKA